MMNITISRYQPLRGGSYIVLPEYISDKKHASTYKNEDDNCLKWVLRSARFPCSNNTDRTFYYYYYIFIYPGYAQTVKNCFPLGPCMRQH